MITKTLYQVRPADPSAMTHIKSHNSGKSGEMTLLDLGRELLYWGVFLVVNIFGLIAMFGVLGSAINLVVYFVDDDPGLYKWVGFLFFSLFALWVFYRVLSIMIEFSDKKDAKALWEFRKQKAKEEAETYSKQLNGILEKSEEIVNNILPYFESSANRSIEQAKIDFAENALSPFWNKIEEASNFLGCYKEAVDQLVFNGEIYSKILDGKNHNFPIPFPIGTNISISQSMLEDFNATIRKAQSNFEFANIWEHRKTQKILVAGFKTLEQAINNMKDAVVSAIYDLKYSIRSEFKELKNIQIEQIQSFEASQLELNNTLKSMDTKLYYMQYHKKPNTPFLRSFND